MAVGQGLKVPSPDIIGANAVIGTYFRLFFPLQAQKRYQNDQGLANRMQEVRTYRIREAELSGDGGEVGGHEALVGEQQDHHHRE